MAWFSPAEGEDDPLVGYHLYEFTHREVLTTDLHPIGPSGSRIEVNLGPQPSKVLLRIDEEREDRFGSCLNDDLAYQFGHSSLLLVLFVGRGLSGLGGFSKSLKSPGPVLIQEGSYSRHFVAIGPIEATGPITALDHQLCLSKDPQVLRDGRSRDLFEVRRNVGSRQFA
jgi:hypothetical protein